MGSEMPDFTKGLPIEQLADGAMLQGKVGEEDVILTRRGDEFFAVGAYCTHYGGPLVKGLLAGDELRCPLHHARFNLRTGEAICPPAFDALSCWRVERSAGKVFVREKRPSPAASPVELAAGAPQPPTSVFIVGGGAAGLAAANTLRREGYQGPVTIISADDSAPYDRPNLSKDYLAGQAQEDWIPLRSPDYYAEQRIDLALNMRVTRLDAARRRIQLDYGSSYDFGALLLATGSEPVRLPVPGASDAQLCYLRTLSDSRQLIEKAASAKQVVVVGASFIGLEVAASLRERGVGVHVVAPERQPLERVLGPEVGRFLRALHEAHEVVFHLGETVTGVEGRKAILSGGAAVDADLLVLGVGVRPSIALAEQAGLKVDRGVLVNEYLETSAPGIFAAGDIARWPDAYSGELLRIEHWVVAERQGRVAARNILGRRERFTAVPFFWTRQYGVSVNYTGHAEKWDRVEIDGSLEANDCAVRYKLGARTLATATISRDLENLRFEAALESTLQQAGPRSGREAA